MSKKTYYIASDVCKILDISYNTFFECKKRGMFPPSVSGSSKYKIGKEEFDDWLKGIDDKSLDEIKNICNTISAKANYYKSSDICTILNIGYGVFKTFRSAGVLPPSESNSIYRVRKTDFDNWCKNEGKEIVKKCKERKKTGKNTNLLIDRDKYYTSEDVQKILGISRTTFYNWKKLGKLPPSYLNVKYRVKVEDFNEWYKKIEEARINKIAKIFNEV